MQFWNWLRTMLMGDPYRELAEQIARDCQAGVWVRVARRAPLMSLAEARGYVRARSGLVVREAVNRELEVRRGRLLRPDAAALSAATTDAVIRLVLKQVLETRHAPLSMRRAA